MRVATEVETEAVSTTQFHVKTLVRTGARGVYCCSAQIRTRVAYPTDVPTETGEVGADVTLQIWRPDP